jgi:hypothetical protein
MTIAANPRAGYTGHDTRHAGLQGHSLGDIYPRGIVGTQAGPDEPVLYRVENLIEGTVLAFTHAPHVGRPFALTSAAALAEFVRDCDLTGTPEWLGFLPR